MKIFVVSGIGQGKTLLSAFDAALNDAGVSNYNLITLSSVIPPQAEIIKTKKYHTPDSEWGHKLYLVKAEMRTDKKGVALAAGVGWYQLEDGRGLFVEHETEAKTEPLANNIVKTDIYSSLEDLCNLRSIPYDSKKVQTNIISAVCKGKPVCVLSLAIYQSQGWN